MLFESSEIFKAYNYKICPINRKLSLPKTAEYDWLPAFRGKNTASEESPYSIDPWDRFLAFQQGKNTIKNSQ
jgi:hypothetical protein